MTATSDAGPLIWLGKCELLHLLRQLYREIAIPESVHKEAVIIGLEKGYENAQIIKKALNEEWIKAYKVDKKFKEKVETMEKKISTELGAGEREAIALALEKKTSILLTNDEDAYLVGKILGLNPKGVLYVLLKSVKEKHLSKKKAKESLNHMLQEGFWLSPIIVYKFYQALNRL
ncbi:MAG: DUF3368 domain-containing protein [Candidatus Jordarchaeum sp.]|uniref:DUF3368 domain-containing protein n=1 Tax=Candidatus Jordarchaeum sp. TaxID=2823881 RepID=UPI00404A3733